MATSQESNIRSSDSKARITLPKGFTNTLLQVEQIDEFEVRIRKVAAIPVREMWLWHNPNALESVMIGIEGAKNCVYVDGPDLAADAAEFHVAKE